MIKKKKPDDYVISTGKSCSVRQFVEKSFKVIGIDIVWRGKGVNEVGYDKSTKNILIRIDKKYYRPNEVHDLRENYKKAKKILKWSSKVTLNQMIKEMVMNDIDKFKKSLSYK